MNRLTAAQAGACENATGDVCRCRCQGALHGVKRTTQTWQLPNGDPHASLEPQSPSEQERTGVQPTFPFVEKEDPMATITEEELRERETERFQQLAGQALARFRGQPLTVEVREEVSRAVREFFSREYRADVTTTWSGEDGEALIVQIGDRPRHLSIVIA